MVVRLHKEVQLFKKVITQDRFGDHVQEVRFKEPVCVTGIKVGAPPGAAGLPQLKSDARPAVRVFAREAGSLPAARLACLCEPCLLPTTGTQAVRFEPTVTDELVLRGNFQTLPIAIYGWALSSHAAFDPGEQSIQAAVTAALDLSGFGAGGVAANSDLFALPAAKLNSSSASDSIPPPPFERLPADALAALKDVLPTWREAGASCRRLAAAPLPEDVHKALRAAADKIVDAIAASATATPAAPAVAAAGATAKQNGAAAARAGAVSTAALLAHMLTPREAQAAAAAEAREADEAAQMTAEWLALLAKGPVGDAAAQAGLASLPAAVLVCSSPRHAHRFLAHHGVVHLASVLSLAYTRPPAGAVRYGLAACEALVLTTGGLGCEALLGWWRPPDAAAQLPQPAEQDSHRMTNGSAAHGDLRSLDNTQRHGDESDEEAKHDEGGVRDDMYDDVYNDGYGEGEGDGGEAAAGGGFDGEDYGSLEYDYYREEGGDGENGSGHEHNGHAAGGSGGGIGDDAVDIYGDVDEGMDVDAGQQQDQQQGQQQRPASVGLKGGRHPGNLALRGGGGRGGSRGSRSRSPSRDDDRWGGSQDAPSQLDQPGADEDMLAATPDRLSPEAATSGRAKDAERSKDPGEKKSKHKHKKRHRSRDADGEGGRGKRSKRGGDEAPPAEDRKGSRSRSKRSDDPTEADRRPSPAAAEGQPSRRSGHDTEAARGDDSRDDSRRRLRSPERPGEAAAHEAPRRDDTRRPEVSLDRPAPASREADRPRDRRPERTERNSTRRSSPQRWGSPRRRDSPRRQESPQRRSSPRYRDSPRRGSPERRTSRRRDATPDRRHAAERRDRSAELEHRSGRDHPSPHEQHQASRVVRRDKEPTPASTPRRGEHPTRGDSERHYRGGPERRHREGSERRHGSPVPRRSRSRAASARRDEEADLAPNPPLSPREEEPQQSPEADPMDIPEGPLPSPLRSPAAAEDARDERRHRPRRARSPVDSERLYRKFGGAYPALVEVLLQLRPQSVGAMGAWLLCRLRAYEQAASFQVAATQLADAHAPGGAAMPTGTATALVAAAGAALGRLAELLRSSGPSPQPDVLAPVHPGVVLVSPPEPEPTLLAALAGRGIIPSLAAALRVPGAHVAALTASGALPPSAPSAAAIAAPLSQPLLAGARALLGVLLSSAAGVAWLRRQPTATAALLDALHPGAAASPLLDADTETALRGGAGAELALALRAALAAAQAADALAACPPPPPAGSPPAAAADDTRALPDAAVVAAALLGATATEPGRRAVVAALLANGSAFRRLLQLVQGPPAPPPTISLDGTPVASTVPATPPDAAAIHAAALLAEVLRDRHPAALAAWLPSADAVTAAATAFAASVDTLPKPGRAGMKAVAAELAGRAAAASALSKLGADGLVGALSSDLPAFGAVAKPTSGEAKANPQVEHAAAVAMAAAPDRLAGADTGLALVAAASELPGGGRFAAAFHDAGGLALLERGVRTATVLLAACDADTRWGSAAGAAVDEAAAASSRERAVAFAASAATAAAMLLQRLQAANMDLSSRGLQRALLALHTSLAATPESLAAALGRTPAPDASPALQARFAVVDALRSWLEGGWRPELIPTLFVASEAPASFDLPPTIAQGPAEMLAAALLLGDLFPTEWPPPGAARRPGQPHPPPPGMAARAAMARALEDVTGPLQGLLATAAGCHARVLRAALVRLTARAAGLGGGMGLFLAGPLAEELRAATAAEAPLVAGRRVLEVLVPLVYRPAIKAALLQLETAAGLARLLATAAAPEAVHHPAHDEAEAAAVATMVLEAATVLLSPEVCLDPSLPGEQRAVMDTPPLPEAASLVAVILGCLPRLGSCAHIAARLVRSLAAGRPGRTALAGGAGRWRAAALGPLADPADAPSALQWAATRLWQHTDAMPGELEAMRGIRQEMASVLQAAAVAALDDGERGEEDFQQHAPPPAPARFAAAVQAAVAAAAEAGAAPDDGTETPLASAHDAASRTFWRNVAARSAHEQPSAFGPAPVVWEVEAADKPSPFAAHIPEGLAPIRHPRSEPLSAFTRAKPEAPAKDAVAAVKEEPGAKGAAEVGSSMVPKLEDKDLPGADLPPVVAPSRGPQRRQGRGAGNRPSSMHVDDFERRQGNNGPAAPAATAAKPPSPRSRSPRSRSRGRSRDRDREREREREGSSRKEERRSKSPRSDSKKGSGASASASAKEAILANPEAAAELFRDPKRLQRLLEENPALISVLKSRLGK